MFSPEEKLNISEVVKKFFAKVSKKEIDDEFKKYFRIKFDDAHNTFDAELDTDSCSETVEWEKDTTNSWDWEPSGIAKSRDTDVYTSLRLEYDSGYFNIYYYGTFESPSNDDENESQNHFSEYGYCYEFTESVRKDDEANYLINEFNILIDNEEQLKEIYDVIQKHSRIDFDDMENGKLVPDYFYDDDVEYDKYDESVERSFNKVFNHTHLK